MSTLLHLLHCIFFQLSRSHILQLPLHLLFELLEKNKTYLV